MDWTTKLPSGAVYSGSIDDSFKDDDVRFVMDFTRLAMKARLGYFVSSRPDYSMKFVEEMAAPSKNKSVAEIIALEALAAAAIAWKNSDGDYQFDILYRAVEEFERREHGKVHLKRGGARRDKMTKRTKCDNVFKTSKGTR